MLKKILFVLMLCFVSITAKSVDFPALTGQVVDEAGILTQATKNNILSTMTPDQQFVVVTLKSLRGYEIEDYALALGRYWGIGSKENDDGLLLVVAPNERQVRIEVGYGLENVITDYKASQIIQNRILPAFKQGDYNRGILMGVQALQQVLSPNGKHISFEPQSSDNRVRYSNGGMQYKSSTGGSISEKIGSCMFFLFFNIIPSILVWSCWYAAKKIKEGDEEVLKNYRKSKREKLQLNALKNWKRLNILFKFHILYLIACVCLIGVNNNFSVFGCILVFPLTIIYGFLLSKWGLLEEGSSRGGSYHRDSSWGHSSSRSSFSGRGGSFGGGGASGRW